MIQKAGICPLTEAHVVGQLGYRVRAAVDSWLCNSPSAAKLLGLFPICEEGIRISGAVWRLKKDST